MPSNQSLRSSTTMWCLRALQTGIALAIISIAATDALDWQDVSCNIPEPLQLNLGAAIISFLLLFYLLLATGYFRFQSLPWSQYLQAFLDLILCAVWIFTASTKPYKCDGVCQACATPAELQNKDISNSGFYVWLGHITCSCYRSGQNSDTGIRRLAVQILRHTSAQLRPGKGIETTKVVSTVQRLAAKQGVNAAMAVLFAISFAVTCLYTVQQRRVVKARHVASVSPSHSFLKDPEKKAYKDDMREVSSDYESDSSPPSPCPPR